MRKRAASKEEKVGGFKRVRQRELGHLEGNVTGVQGGEVFPTPSTLFSLHDPSITLVLLTVSACPPIILLAPGPSL